MKKRIIALIPLCTPLAELHVEAEDLAPEEFTTILKAELSELLKNGWVWNSQ